MLSKDEVESEIAEVQSASDNTEEELPDWEHWRDSEEIHCWVTQDWEWVLQIGHSKPYVALMDLEGELKQVVVRPGSEEAVKGLVSIAGLSPEKAYEYLEEKEASRTMDYGMMVNELTGRVLGHAELHNESENSEAAGSN